MEGTKVGEKLKMSALKTMQRHLCVTMTYQATSRKISAVLKVLNMLVGYLLHFVGCHWDINQIMKI